MASMRRKLDHLSAQLAACEAALRSEQEQSREWRRCMRDLFFGLLLNARMNARYEAKVATRIERAISRLEQIQAVRYIKCSFPSVPTDAPQLALRRWASLDDSEWEVAFSPTSWKIELCLEGYAAAHRTHPSY